MIDLKTGKKFTIEGRDIGEKEPVFIIRARDLVGRAAVRQYAATARAACCEPEFVASCEKAAKAMDRWAEKNKSDLPD